MTDAPTASEVGDTGGGAPVCAAAGSRRRLGMGEL